MRRRGRGRYRIKGSRKANHQPTYRAEYEVAVDMKAPMLMRR
jgi:hypothetical protein